MMRITQQRHWVHKEPLSAPFGFKGGYLGELWQSAVSLQTESGASGFGLGVQSILWSDPAVFMRYGEQRGNEMMSDITRYALSAVENSRFESPFALLDAVLPATYEYGKRITALPELRLTFALNALVGLDQAAWSVSGQEKEQSAFPEMVPEDYRAALPCRHSSLACIPIVSYGMAEADIVRLLEDGYCLLKIKLGADPSRDGDQGKMLTWDKERLSSIHRIARNYGSDRTASGRIAYYLDANGRYESKEYLLRFLEHADSIGALEHILLLEEPFPEEYRTDVAAIPVRLAADESVHNERDALERIEMGFRAFALKPVAKTMSLSLKLAKLAHEKGIACFCADLTANPILADWNKNLAACLAPLPGMRMGAIETNGHQNYLNWDKMIQKHPYPEASWIRPINGVYALCDEFYRCNGGALDKPHLIEGNP